MEFIIHHSNIQFIMVLMNYIRFLLDVLNVIQVIHFHLQQINVKFNQKKQKSVIQESMIIWIVLLV